ncbi:hypothetical protein HMPREF1250_1999 [Megasphaera vaginalis (ex Srinivasan et al. 2021)]|uniref:Uncharacterized protein n=1 Tax=Megasphaera vaginalis (ex Srinivasan et al. 2021) TaxID=1111454 RepID=U7URM0_9FIRM|nr:hypothetical protein HMPREF1250_1999 [Megasphaera vaginalis (ex Srinivasan et al. 2021)]
MTIPTGRGSVLLELFCFLFSITAATAVTIKLTNTFKHHKIK